MESPIVDSVIFPDSFIIDKKNLCNNEHTIAKIHTTINELQNSSKLDDFTNFVVTTLYEKKHIAILKSYGGRIKILMSIIKKLNAKVLFVCNSYFESAEYTKIFYNYQ